MGDPGCREEGSKSGNPDGKSVAARLVKMAQAHYLLGVTDEGEPFGARKTQPHVALLLRGGRTGLRAELAARYFAATDSAAGGQALSDSALILEGIATTRAPERLYLRIADRDGAIYIDTGRTDGLVIRIADGEWSLADSAPVRFLRTKLTGEAPLPSRGGNLSLLWDFVNVADEDRPVLLAVLVAALVQCDVPHPVLALFAEQGSAKSTTTRMLVDLVDPSPVPLRQAPRDADSWVTAASGSWVVALDNLSGIPAWFSDALCRAVTGDGSVKRALYTDAGLAVLRFRRCVIVNGIDVGTVRPDLAERLAVVDLKRIDRKHRRAESQITEEWQQALPTIWSGLLDLAAAVHKRLGSIIIRDAPRMADYARVLAAVDTELGTDGLRRYLSRADQLSEDSLSSNPFIERLRASLSAPMVGKSGADLLSILTPMDEHWRRPKDWPSNGRDVTTVLRRHAPALRGLGWHIEDDGARNHRNVLLWSITPPQEEDQNADAPSQTSQASSALAGHQKAREEPASHRNIASSREEGESLTLAASSRDKERSPCANEGARNARNSCGSDLLLSPVGGYRRGVCKECRARPNRAGGTECDECFNREGVA